MYYNADGMYFDSSVLQYQKYVKRVCCGKLLNKSEHNKTIRFISNFQWVLT